MGQVELARLLRDARRDRGLSLRDVAGAASTTASYVQRLERGEVGRPGAGVLVRLAVPLGLGRAQVLRAAGFL